jgi:hypothetical protein
MSLLVPMLLLAATLNAETHEKDNPSTMNCARRACPSDARWLAAAASLMPDGLDAKAQRALIEACRR